MTLCFLLGLAKGSAETSSSFAVRASDHSFAISTIERVNLQEPPIVTFAVATLQAQLICFWFEPA